MPLWDTQEMAVILGVGYPNPNLSHFRGIDIWNSASDSEDFLPNGWISHLFQESWPGKRYASDGINLANNPAGALNGNNARIVTLGASPEVFVENAIRVQPARSDMNNSALLHILKQRQDLRDAAESLGAKNIETELLNNVFPKSKLGAQFQIAARLIIAGAGAPVLKMTLSQFDTHTSQGIVHADLLSEVASNISIFAKIMKARGLWDKVAVMTYSEFGRRPKQNNSSGTDHGTAAPQFVFGGKVKGGFYGEQPPLDDLDNGNLKHRVHFRELYASIARDWWGLRADHIKEKSLGLF